jgi:hypothetical protein
VFLLGAQFLWAFFARPDRRLALVAANAAAAVSYLPWLPTLIDNADSPGSKVIGFLSPFNLSSVRVELGRWGLGHPYIPLRDLPGWVGIGMFLAGIALGATGLLIRLISSQRLARPSAKTTLIFVLALATPVGLLVYSLLGDSVWTGRNLISSWPALALAVGALVTAATGPLRVVAVGLVVAAIGIGAVKMLDADNQRPSYAEAAEYIERNSRPGDPLVEAPAPTPGPLAPLTDVALANLDGSTPHQHPALRLGYPSLRAKLRAPPYALVPVPSAETIARRAARLADGRFYVVIAGPQIAQASLLDPFEAGLPPRYRKFGTRTFPGFVPLSVHEFRDEG